MTRIFAQTHHPHQPRHEFTGGALIPAFDHPARADSLASAMLWPSPEVLRMALIAPPNGDTPMTDHIETYFDTHTVPGPALPVFEPSTASLLCQTFEAGPAGVDRAVDGVINGIFFNAGQVCDAGSRLIVQDDIHDSFVDKLVAKVQNLAIRAGLYTEAFIGCICIKVPYPPQDLAMFGAHLSGQAAAV